MYFGNGDEFIANPVPEIIQIQQFLNVPVMINEKQLKYDEKKGFYCIIRKQYRRCLCKSNGRKHPNVSERSKKNLTDFYKLYIKQFIHFLKKGFKWAM